MLKMACLILSNVFAHQLDGEAVDMLRRFGMDRANAASTPLPPGFVLIANNCEPSADHHLFRDQLSALRSLADAHARRHLLRRQRTVPLPRQPQRRRGQAPFCRFIVGTVDTGV